jgi:(1->4)-alpha-D-glucan 1-alpha-D-glucosylmutase
MNEAKVNTSWINQNEPYQEAVASFIEAILRPGEDNRFLADFLPFQRVVAHYGALNALSQTLIKLASPGVPDIYQGNELWDFSLVDPDNRRPVDYDQRRRLLREVDRVRSARGAASLVESWQDGRVKLLVTSRALRYRRDNHALFAEGAYTPLEAQGTHASNVIAFARSHGDKSALVVAPRLTARFGKVGEPVMPVGEVWSGTRLIVPDAQAGDTYRNLFTGETAAATEVEGAVSLALVDVLAAFPVALLVRE